jgi:Arc/MetJ-type ribon-helix-helix transcriptional regulator
MVSLRIPEDYMLELDQRVGLDGTRNRSDVIRKAIRKFIATPLSQMNEKVEVDLGPDLAISMRDFCK